MLRLARREMAAGEYRLIDLFVELPYGAALVGTGEMARGTRLIAEAADRIARLGQPFAHAYGEWILGEIYLRMVLGEERPPLPIILRNLGFLLRTLPVAARKARRHIEAAVEHARRLDMPSRLAMSLYSLGLLHKAKRRPAEARACLEEARPIAASVEAATLVDQIDAALQSLD